MRSRRARYLPLAVLWLACGDNLQPPSPWDPSDEEPTDRTLFAADRIWDIDIELDAEDILALQREPTEYVPADVSIGGIEFRDAGVRLKGSFSFRPLGDKAAFKIRLDRFQPGQRLGALHRLTLNNMWQSRGLVSEWLGYRIFAAAGVPAPRAGFAWVRVNGEPYGLYANVETEDEYFLARHFADAGGPLFEAELTDLTPEDVPDFEQEQGGDDAREALAELVAAVGDAGDGLFFDDPALLEVEDFLALVAGEAIIGHWDGYWKAHNYRLYQDPSTGRWSLLPWGIDQSFERPLDPFDSGGLLARKCVGSDRCLQAYTAVGAALLAALAAEPLVAELDAVTALIEPALELDPRMPYGPDKVRRHQAAVRDYLPARLAALTARYGCAGPDGELDVDGDGFGACLEDCDDDSDASHPGGVEVCDGRDNDCDGLVDEVPGCGCEEVEGIDDDLLLCVNAMSWSAASAHCAALGGELAWFEDRDQARAVAARARARVADHWYFAVNDRAEEGRWVAGEETVDFSDWASDEPDSFGDEDCAVLDRYASGAWSDVRCGEAHPFVCAVP